jgi:hypothetical protein
VLQDKGSYSHEYNPHRCETLVQSHWKGIDDRSFSCFSFKSMLKAYESVKEKEKLCLKKRKICMFLLLFFIVCEKRQVFSKTIAENIYEKRKRAIVREKT